MNRSQALRILLIIFILGDLTYSFLQYYHTPLYGDIEEGVLPASHIQEIFDDPTGLKAIIAGEKHINPNRFFSHLSFKAYFRNAPFLFQNFVEPITSVYLACAVAKLLLHVLIIYLLSTIITNTKNIFHLHFLIVAALLSPLFQTYGYWTRMAIIDKSIAYTFFYAVPLTLLLLFFKPIFNIFFYQENKPWRIELVYLVPLVIILPLSGPLSPAVIFIVSMLLFFYHMVAYRKQHNFRLNSHLFGMNHIPKKVLYIIIPISIFSLYSLVLGSYDSNYGTESIPLFQRYLRLPGGILSHITHSFGFPLVLMIIGLNLYIIRKKFKGAEATKIMNAAKWIGIFAATYLALLPLGGYRPYRPDIVRYDSIMPITLGLFFILGQTTFFLYRTYRSSKYWVFIIVSMLVFTFSDISKLNKNQCEIQALRKISASSENIVELSNECTILSWHELTDYKDSELKGELLLFWNITDEKKLFYQK